ncbi:M15 family metallopeptidase [Mycolicibacter minnesotensis]
MRRLATAIAVCGLLTQCAPASPPEAAPVAPSTTAPRSAGPIISAVGAAELGASWHPGCPVGPEQLRRISLDHLGFDNRTQRGELIVHEKVVPQVIAIFDSLHQLGYPIEKMRSVAQYQDADDERSMADNNTSAFNCRRIPGSGRWARHAYGLAIDLNPLLNPSMDGSGVRPKNGAVYLDRHRIEPGLLHAGDEAVRVFTDAGWRWGGNWKSQIDYQHFELPG